MLKFIRPLLLSLLLLTSVVAFAQDNTATPETQEQSDATLQGDNAYVRVANFAGATGPVTVSLGTEQDDFEPVEFKTIGDWRAVPAGDYSISLTGADNQSAGSEIALQAGSWTTLAVVHGADSDALILTPFQENYPDLVPGTSGITIVHAAQNAPRLNMLRDEVVFVSDLVPLGQSGGMPVSSFPIDSGDYAISFVEPELPDTVVVGDETEITESGYLLIAVVDGESGPELLTDLTTAAEVAMVKGELPEPGTILEAAESQANLSGLLDAFEQAGLSEELSGAGPFTIFAPADYVLDDANFANGEDLATVLRSHIVDGALMSRDVLEAGTLTTLAGTDLNISLQGDNIFVNEAQVIAVNIPATNGVIHLINHSLVPSE